MEKKLTRVTSDKMISGVCSGFAKYLDLDPTLVRIGYALLTLLSIGCLGVILYFVCAIVMPEEA